MWIIGHSPSRDMGKIIIFHLVSADASEYKYYAYVHRACHQQNKDGSTFDHLLPMYLYVNVFFLAVLFCYPFVYILFCLILFHECLLTILLVYLYLVIVCSTLSHSFEKCYANRVYYYYYHYYNSAILSHEDISLKKRKL